MANQILGYMDYVARSGDTYDLIATQVYGTSRMTHYIMHLNKDYLSTLVFQGGEQLRIPVMAKLETAETQPPWRR